MVVSTVPCQWPDMMENEGLIQQLLAHDVEVLTILGMLRGGQKESLIPERREGRDGTHILKRPDLTIALPLMLKGSTCLLGLL